MSLQPVSPLRTGTHTGQAAHADCGNPGQTKATSPTGTCTLVGAGPGDPDLLTLKAVKAIQQANLLLVDDLVSDDIVALASPGTRVVHVGKRGGCQSTPQAFIEKLMLQAVQAGERVVRLKGGDPFVFGRGGEEVEHLQTAGVAGDEHHTVRMFAVRQRHAQRSDSGQPGSSGTDWRALAATCHQARLTLVIYMGVSGAARIQAELLTGLPATTPVAIIQHASLPQQRHAVCELQHLHATLQAEQLGSPSVMVVGDVMQGLLALGQQRTAQTAQVA